jgi:hypothetical protein
MKRNKPKILSNKLDQAPKTWEYYREILKELMPDIIRAFENPIDSSSLMRNGNVEELSSALEWPELQSIDQEEILSKALANMAETLNESFEKDKEIMNFINKLLIEISSPEWHTGILDEDLNSNPEITKILTSYFNELKDNNNFSEEERNKLESFYRQYQNILDKIKDKEDAERVTQKKKYKKEVFNRLLKKSFDAAKRIVKVVEEISDSILYRGWGSSKAEVERYLQISDNIEDSSDMKKALLSWASDIKKDWLLLIWSLAVPSAILWIAVSKALQVDNITASTTAWLIYYMLMYRNDSKAIRQLSLDKFSSMPIEKNIFKKILKSTSIGWRIALILVTSWFAADYAKWLMFGNEANRALKEKITNEVKLLEEERDIKIDNKTATLKSKWDFIQKQKEDLRDEIKNGRNGRWSWYGDNAKETERILREEETKYNLEKKDIDDKIKDIEQEYKEKINQVSKKYTGFFEKIKALDELLEREPWFWMKVHAIMIMLLLLELIPLLSKMRKTQNTLRERITWELEKNWLIIKNKYQDSIMEELKKNLKWETETITYDAVTDKLKIVIQNAMKDVSAMEDDTTISQEMKRKARELITRAQEKI